MYLREQVIRINSYQQQTIESSIHFYSINLMLIAKPTQNRFQLSFKKKEVPIFHKLENDLMEDLGIPTKSDLYKYSIKFLASTRKRTPLAMV